MRCAAASAVLLQWCIRELRVKATTARTSSLTTQSKYITTCQKGTLITARPLLRYGQASLGCKVRPKGQAGPVEPFADASSSMYYQRLFVLSQRVADTTSQRLQPMWLTVRLWFLVAADPRLDARLPFAALALTLYA